MANMRNLDHSRNSDRIGRVIDSPEVPGPVFDEALEYEDIKKVGRSSAFVELREKAKRREDRSRSPIADF